MTDKHIDDISSDTEYVKDDLKVKSHLLAYDLLKSQASWLENPNNEIFSLLEFDDDSLNIAAKASIIAAEVLKKAAVDIQLTSGITDTNKYSKDVIDAMNDLRALADEFDASGNDQLMKKAGLLDEILITMASGVEEKQELEKKFNKKIADIKERIKNNKTEKTIVTAERDEKKDSKKLRPLEAPLQSRYCPSCHAGQMSRLRDDVWYCSTCSNQIDYKEGYTTIKGNKVPATSVGDQTSGLSDPTIKVMFGDSQK